MGYTPAPLTDPVVLLQIGYTPPALTDPVVLCAEEEPSGGGGVGLIITTAPVPPVTVRGRGGAYRINGHVDTAPIILPPTLQGRGTAVSAGTALAYAALPQAPVALTGRCLFDHDLVPGTTAAIGLPNRTSRPLAAVRARAPQAEAIRVQATATTRHAEALTLPATAEIRNAEAPRLRNIAASRHAQALPVTTQAAVRHAEALRARRALASRHAEALRMQTVAAVRHAECLVRRPVVGWRHAEGLLSALGLVVRLRPAPPATVVRLVTRTALAIWPAPGRWWPEYEPPGLRIVIDCDGSYTPPALHCAVVLGPDWMPQPWCPVDLPKRTIVIPIKRTYQVLNSFSLARVSDGYQIVPTSTFTASLDYQSWAWTWSTTCHADYLPLLRQDANGPVELVATINGQALRLRVERLGRERRFGRADLRISGRSRSSELAAPYAPVVTRSNATALTAQQIAADVLTDNGVGIGWGLDWQIDDWPVPAGAFNHSGAWMDAITYIAAAAGAYVQPHDTAQTLRILPLPGPGAWWEWGDLTADIALPEDVATVEGIEWRDRPDYDTVYIAAPPVLGHVTRTGYAGSMPAPMVSEPLLAHPTATLQRGRAVLNDTGRQADIRLSLPVLASTGIIKPGLLLDYTEGGNTHRGLTRGVSVQVDFPRIVQTVEIETREPA